jgi:hypothetical protein
MQYKPTWDLQSIPDDVFRSEIGRRSAARRKTAGGYRENAGRKPEMVPCPRGCGQIVSKTEAQRGHGCQLNHLPK